MRKYSFLHLTIKYLRRGSRRKHKKRQDAVKYYLRVRDGGSRLGLYITASRILFCHRWNGLITITEASTGMTSDGRCR